MKKTLLILALIFSFGQMLAQKNSVWQKITTKEVAQFSRVRQNINTEGEQYFKLNFDLFKQNLVNVKDKFSNQEGVTVQFPNCIGEFESFKVWENSNFEPELQAKYPNIRAYVGKSEEDGSIINFSISPLGVQTIYFKTNNDTEFIESYNREASTYVVFSSKNRNTGKTSFNCTTIDLGLDNAILNDLDASFANKSDNAKYKTMRLALSCTGEYGTYFGGTVVGALAGMNATMTRVNGVMEKDLAMHLNIISNNDLVIYTDAFSDPYSDAANIGNWNSELMNTLHNTLGDAVFDIGHLFGSTGGGGNAGCIGCVCNNTLQTPGTSTTGYKGSGYTSPGPNTVTGIQDPPTGDNFDIDYVAHEMGHQLGGNHSFSYGGIRNVTQAEISVAGVEPGSGSTIMAYAGVAYDENSGASYNSQFHSDPFYAWKTINQIQSNLNSATKTCPVVTSLTGINATPTAVSPGNFTIPIGTPFVLTGTGTDTDTSDVLTYVWEQNNLGTSATTGANSFVTATKTVGPTFRTFKPSTNNSRYFPQMGKILATTPVLTVTTGSTANWESLSNVARTLNFTFTVRDNHPGMGQTKTAASVITVDATGGPFTVTSQATTGISYVGLSSQTITWNVANTTAAPFNTATVDIFASTNASTALETYSATTPTTPNPTTWTLIASGVPNNGTYSVTVPNVSASKTTCRFMVKAVGNVFFAVNGKNFTITPSLANEEFGFTNFSIYPNPNKGNFNVKFDSSTNNDIIIMVHDIRGRSIYEKQFPNTGLFSQNLQLDNVQSGVYLVSIKDGDQKIVKKIIIE